MRFLSLYLSLILGLSLFADKQTPQGYIEQYKDLAVIEMYRSGVPASITLAQGILESNSGNSRLALYANNHFGIKCKGSWTGNVIYADDDAPDECFRAYATVLASYQDHSDFLRTNWRYHPLFELETTDYKGWSKGLRKAGYATNTSYHTILINLIERYELHDYDLAPLPGKGPAEPMVAQTVNNVPVMIAVHGQTVSTIAAQNDLRDRHIRKWNDLPDGEEIEEGDIVYLKPKRRRGAEETHIVREGETMRDVSQQYGIKLKHLYKKNRMEYGLEPKPGEVLNMQHKIDKEESIEIAEPTPKWQEPKEEEFVNPHSVKPPTTPDSLDKPAPIAKKQELNPEYHMVIKGDNIYRIAEKYHVFEEDLMIWNKDLNPNALKLGQKIYLSEEAAKKYNNLSEEKIEQEETPTTEAEIEKIKKEIVVDGPVYHHVVKGDTLYNICKRYGVTEAELKTWNGLADITIYIGQKLQVSE